MNHADFGIYRKNNGDSTTINHGDTNQQLNHYESPWDVHPSVVAKIFLCWLFITPRLGTSKYGDWGYLWTSPKTQWKIQVELEKSGPKDEFTNIHVAATASEILHGLQNFQVALSEKWYPNILTIFPLKLASSFGVVHLQQSHMEHRYFARFGDHLNGKNDGKK